MKAMRDWTTRPYPLFGVIRLSRLRSLVGCSDRWSHWARALTERHTRLVDRSAGMSQTLARRFSIVYSQVHRWRHSKEVLFPQINLSMGPISFNPQTLKLKDRFAAGIEKSKSPERERNAQFFVIQKAVDQILLRHLDAKALTGTTNSEGGFYRQPLVRVFGRSADNDGAPELKGISNTTISTEQSLVLVHRLDKERRRFEESVEGMDQTFAQPRAALVPNVQIPTEEVIEASSVRSKGLTRPNEPASWPFDIEQLTERIIRNIDGRILAHRERMGTVF